MFFSWRILLIPSVLLALGCGAGSKGTLSGKVLYGSQALNSGSVSFYPEQGNPVTVPIGQDGNYQALNVPAGPARIAVNLSCALGDLDDEISRGIHE